VWARHRVLTAPCGTERVVYVSEREGSDEHGDGTEAKPFKTVPRALKEGDVRVCAHARLSLPLSLSLT
jgi:hypothetical protein